MRTPKEISQAELDDLAKQAYGLQRWFVSQDMNVARAVEIMSYLMGVMAACMSGDDMDVVRQRLASANDLAMTVAMLIFTEE